jgi:hypothetical protein
MMPAQRYANGDLAKLDRSLKVKYGLSLVEFERVQTHGAAADGKTVHGKGLGSSVSKPL